MNGRDYSSDIVQLVSAIIKKDNVRINLNNADNVMLEISTSEREVKSISLENLLRSVESDVKEVL